MKESVFIVNGMTCANCSNAITKHFEKSVEGINSINVSLVTHMAVINHDMSIIRPRRIIEEIEDLGFEAEIRPNNDTIDIREVTRNVV